MSKQYSVYLFDWGNTLMKDCPERHTPMCQWEDLQVMEGAMETLAYLSQTSDCYLVTNARDSTKSEIVLALKRGGLYDFFRDVFCFQETGLLKPSLPLFNLIQSRLSVPKSDVLMIGDDLLKDVQSALDYGWDAVWYNPEGLQCPEGIWEIRELRVLCG